MTEDTPTWKTEGTAHCTSGAIIPPISPAGK